MLTAHSIVPARLWQDHLQWISIKPKSQPRLEAKMETLNEKWKWGAERRTRRSPWAVNCWCASVTQKERKLLWKNCWRRHQRPHAILRLSFPPARMDTTRVEINYVCLERTHHGLLARWFLILLLVGAGDLAAAGCRFRIHYMREERISQKKYAIHWCENRKIP